MQIIAHGIDLVDCERIEKMLTRHETRFLNRVFKPHEQAYSARTQNRVERLAGRFAAKEAVLKLIGMGWREKISWTDVEVVNNHLGQPEVVLEGQVRDIADAMGIERVSLSITHAANLAIASAVALGKTP